MAADMEGLRRTTFTPEYARGYIDGHHDGYLAGLRAAQEAIEARSLQDPPPPTDIPVFGQDVGIEALNFSIRTLGILHRGKIMTIADLQKRSISDLDDLYGAGPKVMREILARCAENDIHLRA